MKPKNHTLLIVGASGHGRVIADTAEALGYCHIVFYDKNWPNEQKNLSWSVVGKSITAFSPDEDVFIGIGANSVRMALIRQMQQLSARLPTLVHPTAHVSPHAKLGHGCFVGPQAAVNVGCVLGTGVIVNTGALADHDCEIADGVHISPGAKLAGGVSVGVESWIGIGASVREGTKIGARSLVGAGAVVVSNVEDDTRVLGIPARKV